MLHVLQLRAPCRCLLRKTACCQPKTKNLRAFCGNRDNNNNNINDNNNTNNSNNNRNDLDSFAELMDRGLDTGQQFRDMQASMAAALRSQGWFIRDGLLGTDTCLRIRAEVASLHASGLFAQSYSEVVETGEKIWRQEKKQQKLQKSYYFCC
ncbi:unnamed protein product [Polarella glacialis]|uniref:Uncharacterized protein n=1 Tax=Polarella glacialis TaxID=89957 RepID=A0A813IA37_POLGL|nr:unnamed protein product [Polarella glacialis]